MFYLIGFLLGIFLVIYVVILVVRYVLGPLLIVAILVSLVVAIVEYVAAAIAGFAPHGPIAHLRIAPPAPSPDGPDPAYRSYYAGPVLLDYRRVLSTTFRQVWAKIIEGRRDESTHTVTVSFVTRVWTWARHSELPAVVAYSGAAVICFGLWLGAIGAVGFVAVVSVIFAVLLGLLVVGAVATAGGSRLIELTVLFVRGITIECGTCHVRATRPIYRCPNCHAEHRHLLPGLPGVLRRTCRCHTVLPTLLANGKAKLPAQCSECRAQLPIKGLTAPTVHIPVIAGPTAGKSVFMQTAMSRLMLRGDGFEFADEGAKNEFERNLQRGVTDDPRRSIKTVNPRPKAYNVYVGAEGSRSRRLLYLYDPAGEAVESADELAESQFLKHTKGVVFIIDPFSLRQVRSETDRAVLGRVSASNTPPKDSLERFVEALREHNQWRAADRMKAPVAVVLTKADALLEPSGAPHPYAGRAHSTRSERDKAVRDWLTDAGQRDLLSSMDNQFAAVSYFVVSYRDAREVVPGETVNGPVANDDPAAPLLWLLNRKAPI
ncbi:MAG TPA: hypothetical protein VFV67_29760 [Actinophytocola sp.]|uniref:TRAFAC clade GTPase domain-containing protein n=1 Tax=Actinophytocola sp. TaxID=1872138 RepID=UPI002DBD2AE6|nr:hypothetical protein [Actinophytocola sp.]HEU5474851.1 hypothetical protein [Actinophytocola sp.]